MTIAGMEMLGIASVACAVAVAIWGMRVLSSSKHGSEPKPPVSASASLAASAAYPAPDAPLEWPKPPEIRRMRYAYGERPKLIDLPNVRSLDRFDERLATPNQLAAVQKVGIDLEGAPPLRFCEASAILSARSYAEAIIYKWLKQTNAYRGEAGIEAAIVGFIALDVALLDRVIAWNIRSFARGGSAVGKPKIDECYKIVQQELVRLFSEAGY